MTTFERVRANVLKDIASRKTHTPESWAHLMLDNTRRLTNPVEQEKFWNFMQNPTGVEHIPAPVCAPMSDHVQIEQPEIIMCPTKGDDEKSEEIEMKNSYFRNGMSMYIHSKPNKVTSESTPLQVDRLSICTETDEKTDFEMI